MIYVRAIVVPNYCKPSISQHCDPLPTLPFDVVTQYIVYTDRVDLYFLHITALNGLFRLRQNFHASMRDVWVRVSCRKTTSVEGTIRVARIPTTFQYGPFHLLSYTRVTYLPRDYQVSSVLWIYVDHIFIGGVRWKSTKVNTEL